ncbi:MAG: zf-HC2 domain-containing protein [candidate division Zixibacteria bacterium]|nr:zf-HC2 domain-containing protein [candidate division Zixibacteria bacterium]
MQCRKVRSFLSAYSKGELEEAKRREISAHLEQCPECRREEAGFRDVFGALSKLPDARLSDDFNNRLLNRIADERYRETRTRAYLPKQAPAIGMRRMVPVVATFCLMLAFVLTGGIERLLVPDDGGYMVAQQDMGSGNMDDSYLTVQPAASRTFSQHASKHWNFDRQVARANRVRGYMNQLASSNTFADNTTAWSTQGKLVLGHLGLGPATTYRPRPIIRTYIAPQNDAVKEVRQVY